MPETANPKDGTAEATEDKALADFSWDDAGNSEDFFGIKDTAIVPKVEGTPPEKKEPKPGEKPDLTPPNAVEEVEEEEVDSDLEFFGIKEGATTPRTPEEEEEAEIQEGINYYTDTFAKMKEQGIFHNTEDLPEGEEMTQDKFIELQDSEIESRVDEAFEGFFSELDSDAAAFLKHKKEGGSTQDFFKVYGKHTGTPKGDLDDEKYQETLARHFYKLEGDDSEDIDDKIAWLKDSGKLEKYANKFDTKIKENDKKSKEDLKRQTAAADKASEDSKRAFADSVQEALDNIEQVDNFKFTPKSKKSLFPFITKQTVKVGKNRYITGMQSKLQTALKTPEKMLILAQLLENDFDLSGILADAKTADTKKIKKDIQRQKSGVRPVGSGRTGKKRSLADIDF